jgi:hypothetical protein
LANSTDYSSALYERTIEEMNEFFRNKIITPLLDSNLNGLLLMLQFSKSWENSKLAIKWIQRLFMNIDNGYVKHSKIDNMNNDITDNKKRTYQNMNKQVDESAVIPTLISAMMSNFRTIAFDSLEHRVFTALIDIINQERNGDIIDQSQLKSCVEVIRVMGLCDLNKCRDASSVVSYLNRKQDLCYYFDKFETPFLLSTQEFYEMKM